MNPKILIDATDFNGFVINWRGRVFKNVVGICSVGRAFQNFTIKTSKGDYFCGPSEKLVALNIGPCVSKECLNYKEMNMSPTESIIVAFLHEMSHWGDGKIRFYDHRKKEFRNHDKWDDFLLELIRSFQ